MLLPAPQGLKIAVQEIELRLVQLRARLDQLEQDNEKLLAQNQQLTKDLDQTKQDLQSTTAEKNFWSGHNSFLAFTSTWDSSDADIDIMILAPDGTLYGPKKEKVLGKDVFKEGSDSHGVSAAGAPYKTSVETSSVELEAGDYLVFYRVPQNAPAAAYANLYGFWIYHELIYDPKAENKGFKWVDGAGMGDSKSSLAKPGGLYAWAIFNYDATNRRVTWKPVTGKLPPGIQLPQ